MINLQQEEKFCISLSLQEKENTIHISIPGGTTYRQVLGRSKICSKLLLPPSMLLTTTVKVFSLPYCWEVGYSSPDLSILEKAYTLEMVEARIEGFMSYHVLQIILFSLHKSSHNCFGDPWQIKGSMTERMLSSTEQRARWWYRQCDTKDGVRAPVLVLEMKLRNRLLSAMLADIHGPW